MRKTTKKFILCTAVLSMMSVPTFGSIIGAIQSTGAVGYNSEERYIIELAKGTQHQVLDLQEDNDIYLIDVEGKSVYVNKDYLTIRKVITQTTMEGVKVREMASSDGKLIKTLGQGEIVSVLYQNSNWYNVVLEDGTEGYIYKTQLEDPDLKLVPQKEFQVQKVEVLNWSVAKDVVPRGAIVTIEDVYTGKTFKVKRTFGTNHADVETLTTADTQMLKSIWGGFSWERRPVIVHTNGRMLAASLAGMPHAGDSLNGVSGNGMSGVLDLHFVGSKRHKEGNIAAVVDPQHQAAIQVAANYKK